MASIGYIHPHSLRSQCFSSFSSNYTSWRTLTILFSCELYRRFLRDVIAAMLVDENKDLLLASFVRPPEVSTFLYCYWGP